MGYDLGETPYSILEKITATYIHTYNIHTHTDILNDYLQFSYGEIESQQGHQILTDKQESGSKFQLIPTCLLLSLHQLFSGYLPQCHFFLCVTFDDCT